MIETVGIVGLGIMGGSYAKNIVDAGFRMCGTDVVDKQLAAFETLGGVACESAKDVASRCDVLITSLPSVKSFHDVMTGTDSIRDAGKAGLTVIETSTLPIEDKQAACKLLDDAGIALLDCPVSGTGAQAIDKDLCLYVSGDKEKCNDCEKVFDAFARLHFYVGEFGNGSKMKFVANHLVHIHNIASAEAMVLGMKAGLDPEMIYSVVKAGAGNSRIFELRASMMVADDYNNATMKMELWNKDMKIINDFASELNCPTPLFTAGTDIYLAALANGQGNMDTASVCRVLEKMAALERPSESDDT